MEVNKKDVVYFLGEPKNLRQVLRHTSKMMKRAGLTPEELTAFMLYYIAGLSTKQIAESLELSEKSIRRTTSSATRKVSIQFLVNY